MRRQLERTLHDAYADGLISEDTFVVRMGAVVDARLLDVRSLVGDLRFRRPAGRLRSSLSRRLTAISDRIDAFFGDPAPEVLLALDWAAGPDELLIGRDPRCDVVLTAPSVSRRHARVVLRDGHWVLQDLASTNGTLLNGHEIGRCELRPGDHLDLGAVRLRVD